MSEIVKPPYDLIMYGVHQGIRAPVGDVTGIVFLSEQDRGDGVRAKNCWASITRDGQWGWLKEWVAREKKRAGKDQE